VLRNGNDLTVSDVTSLRQGYSVRRKNLDAELGWGFGEDLAGSSAGRPMFLECDCFVGHGGGGSARTLVAELGARSQSDSLGAEDFGHVPEGFVEPEIFINTFDGPTLVHPAPVGSAARVVALTAADKVFLKCI
jgi:hypothetical protein